MFDLFDELGVAASCTTNAVTFERRKAMTDAVLERGWELLAHNWEQGELLTSFAQDPAKERDIILRSLARSEEHTSELQSLMRISYAVFCLKKKKQQHNTNN